MKPSRGKTNRNPTASPSGPVLAVSVAFLTFAAHGAAAAEWQSLDEVAAAAVAFVRSASPVDTSGGTRRTVTARPLDARLRLRACAAPLETYLPPGGTVRDNTVVGVRCREPVPWKMFVPVSIQTHAHVARMTRALPPGHRLTSADVDWVEQPVRAASAVIRQDLQDPVGQVLKTAAGAGQILRAPMLRPAHVIRRGDRVTLSAGGTGLAIRMQGEALADGAVGDRLRARNRSSGRIVEGTVRAQGLIEIDVF